MASNFATGSSSSGHKVQVMENADELSTLLPEIHTQILCSLPIVDAAKVGLLSKMWMRTWRSIPKLTFNYDKFPGMGHKVNPFLQFIEQTLANHDDSDVQILEFCCCRPASVRDIQIRPSWITYAVRHNVQKLIVYGKIDRVHFKLPTCLFSCKSLEKLELSLDALTLSWPKTFALPNLRNLKLRYLVLVRQDLFSSFPNLVKLGIYFCNVGDLKCMSISSSSLRELVVCSCSRMEVCSVRVEAPGLSKLVYINDDEKKSKFIIPPHAFQVVIKGGVAYMKNASAFDVHRSMIKVTREVFKKKYFSLHHRFIEFLSKAQGLPIALASHQFNNVVMLSICLRPVAEQTSVVVQLLSRCPNLTLITIKIVDVRREAPGVPDSSFVCSTEHVILDRLSSIVIDNFRASEPEVTLVKYLLANTPYLGTMKIVANRDMVINNPRIYVILEYERASTNVDIMLDIRHPD